MPSVLRLLPQVLFQNWRMALGVRLLPFLPSNQVYSRIIHAMTSLRKGLAALIWPAGEFTILVAWNMTVHRTCLPK